ncbi:hypothetical protein GCM10008090_06800 [Arenicella chitinivorans]|uniref:Uncharacterized protein n=1 Tax=Arenicella chitinivorans TaxID=1329800 RepID=A0A918RM86_9GAMM|nr:hypothetical protein GCM10008090_06800 [Arenicella chitinivorans]
MFGRVMYELSQTAEMKVDVNTVGSAMNVLPKLTSSIAANDTYMSFHFDERAKCGEWR